MSKLRPTAHQSALDMPTEVSRSGVTRMRDEMGGPEEPDPRFTIGLLADVAAVLTKHGYPYPVTAKDQSDLQLALFRYLHRRESASEGREP